MNTRFLIAALAAAGACAAAQAEPVALLAPVTYEPDAPVVQKVRDQCPIERQLADHTADALRRSGVGPGMTNSPDGTVVRVMISRVRGVGGGAWTGPKAITLRVELRHDDNTVRATTLNSWSIGGVFAGVKGTCEILDRDTQVLADDIVHWVQDEHYVVHEDEPEHLPPDDEDDSKR